MSLLYDDILANRVRLKHSPALNGNDAATYNSSQWIDRALTQLPRCQVFKISNVSKYYYESCCQNWDLQKDFPNLAPPFPLFWMEYDPPSKILEREDPRLDTGPMVMRDAKNLVGRVGILFNGRKTAEGFELAYSTFIQPSHHDKLCDVDVGYSQGLFHLNQEGSPVRFGPLRFDGVSESDFFNKSLNHYMFFKSGTLMSIPAFLAISFLHCKNVAVAEERPVAALSKKYQKKTGRPLTTFKVLEIDPMKKVLKHEGGSESTGLKRALHVCRGHYKDYREHGLGKHHVKGVWWWADNSRGSLEAGIVNKEYNIKGEKPQ